MSTYKTTCRQVFAPLRVCDFLFFFVLLFFCPVLAFAEDCRAIQMAAELCLTGEGDAGFVASLSILEKQPVDEKKEKSIREHMVLCLVDSSNLLAASKNADIVIQISKDDLFLGAAWYQKASYAIFTKDYGTALAFAKIALCYLEKANISAKEWLAFRDAFLGLSCDLRYKAFLALGDTQSAEKEKALAESFKNKLCGQLSF
jgi:hypothetical protein